VGEGAFGKDGSVPQTIRILAVLDPANRHYLAVEGYQKRATGGDRRILARNASPVDVGPGDGRYRVDSLVWVAR
jgi:hypothetical protein